MPSQKSEVVRVIPAGAPTSMGENHFINCYPESVDNSLTQVKRAYCVKRKGLKNTFISKTTVTGEARGVYYWKDTDYTFVVYGSTVYAFSSASSTVEQFTVALTTSTGPVGFTEAVYGDARALFFCDGAKGYVISSLLPTTLVTVDNTSVTDYIISNAGTGYTTATAAFSGGGGTGAAATLSLSGGAIIGLTYTDYGSGYTSTPTITVSGDGTGATITAVLNAFPVPHVPQPMFMDGFLFLGKSNSTTIQNCEIGAYQVWKASKYIYVNQFPGNVIGLAKQQNYILALKTDAVEYLHNAANATASPLSRTNQASAAFGLVQPGTVATVEDACMFVGKSSSGGFGVWKIENFKEEKLSTEYIDSILNSSLGLYSITPRDKYVLSGSVIRVDGHKFYVINEVASVSNTRALVYDIDEKFWSFWDSSAVSTTKRYIGIRSADKDGVTLVQAVASASVGRVLYHPKESGVGDYNDNGTVYYSYYNTPVIDMDNRYRKRYNRLEIIGNKYSFTNPVTINYSDSNIEGLDKISNTSWTVNMQNGLQGYLTNLGSSRKRIWQIGHQTDAPLRYENIELFYLQGDH